MRLLICILICLFSLARGIEIAPYVAGPNITEAKHAPWIVSLQMEEGDFAYCGATLISSITTEYKSDSETKNTITYTANCYGWIATTVSCTEGVPLPVIATLGKYDLDSKQSGYKSWSVSESDFIKYEAYNETTRENDIALFNVKYEVKKELVNESDKAKTLCEDEVPALKYWRDYEMNETHHPQINATVFGWGLKNEDGPLQTKLYNLTIPLKRDLECVNAYDHETFFPQNMICAGSVGNSPCSYDTGGPLLCDYLEVISQEEKKTDRYLCGIISFGLGCGRGLDAKPAIFTDIANEHIHKWINDTIYDNTPGITRPTTTTLEPETTIETSSDKNVMYEF